MMLPGASNVPILIGCEESGTVRDAFLARGFDAWSCDLKPDRKGSNRHIRGDIRGQLNRGRWQMIMLAHTPCTRLTNSGVRWLHVPPPGRTLEEMWAELDEGAKLFSDVWNSDAEHLGSENPIMHKYAKERIENYQDPAQIAQPWWFGDPFFKGTGWWLRNLPPLEPTNKLTPPAKDTPEHKAWSMVHRAPPGPNRARDRSTFFPGMSEACADQWGRHILGLPPAFRLAA